MTIDRERLRIDLVTTLVLVVLFALLVGQAIYAWVTYVPWPGDPRPRLSLSAVELALTVGPQLIQALLAQLVLTRLCLHTEVRALFIVTAWLLGLLLCLVVASGGWDQNAAFVYGVLILPLLAVTRLVVRTVLRAVPRIRRRRAARRSQDWRAA